MFKIGQKYAQNSGGAPVTLYDCGRPGWGLGVNDKHDVDGWFSLDDGHSEYSTRLLPPEPPEIAELWAIWSDAHQRWEDQPTSARYPQHVYPSESLCPEFPDFRPVRIK